MSADALLAGMAMGDADAAAVFVRRYQPRVYALAHAIVGSSAVAEEVAQEAFLRVWRNASTYDARRGRVATWVLTITRNLAIDVLRLRGEQPVDPTCSWERCCRAKRVKAGAHSRSTGSN